MSGNKRKSGISILFVAVLLSLCGCGGDLYESNVTAFFLSESIFPNEDLIEDPLAHPVYFEGFETYEALEETIEFLLSESQLESIAEGLSEVAHYASSSDDYLFLVWHYFGYTSEGRWFYFDDNTLESHQAYDCARADLIVCTFDVVAVSRDLVDDFETVAFDCIENSVCNIWEELFG